VLQAAAALCFVGHGAFGVITKAAWVPYFGVVGIGRETAYALMPVVGLVDIALGLLVLLWPTRAGLVYMAGWAVWTALLRPLAHQGFAEFLERAGNYGVPLALLLVARAAQPGAGWFTRLAPGPLDDATRRRAAWVLRATTGTLLLGHGLLAVSGKPLLSRHLAAVGLGDGAAATLRLVAAQGWIEIALAAAVFALPAAPLLLAALAWKVGTEMLFPLTGDSFWEFVERGGSYGAPLTLMLLQRIGRRSARAPLPAPGELVHHQAFTGGTLMKKAATLAVAACVVALAANAPAATNAELKEKVRATEAAFAKSMADRDHAAFVSHLADETVFFGRTVQRGKAAVAAAWKPFFDGPKAPFSWAPAEVEVLDSGTLALTSGPVYDPGGKRTGTFTSVWRLEPDGQWKIVLDKGCPPCDCGAEPATPKAVSQPRKK